MLPVYTSGESISIRCLPPNPSEVVHIQYFKDGKKFEISLEKLYVISSLSTGKKGNYSCGYMCNRYGRQILSKTSQSVSITVVDIPRAPSIILTPKLPFYIAGETISFKCSLPEESTAAIIQYFKNNQEILKSKTPKTKFTYDVSNVSVKNTGSYTCQYCLSYSGRNIVSRSLPISITVEDPPSTPVLNLAPNLEIFVVGESVVLTCHGFVNARHNIYKDGLLLLNDFTHLIPNLRLSHNGNYTCAYILDNKGRQVESSRSETVNIYVIDPLPAPTLTLGGPIVKVEDGIKVILNCSAPDDELLRTFYYFSTTEENDVTNLTAFSASFELELEPISHISYICEYEQELRGRKIRSRRSQTLYIQLSDGSLLSPPEIAGIIGAVSLLLCFTLALWFYMKSKKYNRQNRFRFSWYWKENQSPKISHPLHPLCPVKKTEGTNQVVEPHGEGNKETVSRSPSSLSIFTQKDTDDAIEKPMNFSTFHYENQSEEHSTSKYTTF
ncbi:Fc receptor-like protein 5 [Eleutherodactylus coqui]|uniref:Fc receptor-like protein 5 n=1 Tax=Eleutherodactylus coqui TaxID=57060 RepID=UPI00346371E1